MFQSFLFCYNKREYKRKEVFMKNKQIYYTAASFTALFFVFLGYIVKFYPHRLFFDTPIQQLIRGHLPEKETIFFKWITQFINPLPLILLTVTVMLYLYMQKETIASIWLGLNILLCSGLLNTLMKFVYKRKRPLLSHLVHESSYSFPSGHATSSIIFFGTLFFIASRLFSSQKIKLLFQVSCGIFILLIGLSRIYLGVHYPSDILGGYLLGSTWLLATYPFYQRFFIIFHFKQQNKKRSLK